MKNRDGMTYEQYCSAFCDGVEFAQENEFPGMSRVMVEYYWRRSKNYVSDYQMPNIVGDGREKIAIIG